MIELGRRKVKAGLVIEPLSLVHIAIGVNESASALISKRRVMVSQTQNAMLEDIQYTRVKLMITYHFPSWAIIQTYSNIFKHTKVRATSTIVHKLPLVPAAIWPGIQGLWRLEPQSLYRHRPLPE